MSERHVPCYQILVWSGAYHWGRICVLPRCAQMLQKGCYETLKGRWPFCANYVLCFIHSCWVLSSIPWIPVSYSFPPLVGMGEGMQCYFPHHLSADGKQLLRFPDWPKRGKKSALQIVSLNEFPRATDNTTCEHQPVSLVSIEQWQWPHHLIFFSQFWFCCVPFSLHVLGECCEFHFIAVICVQFCTVQVVTGTFHCYN